MDFIRTERYFFRADCSKICNFNIQQVESFSKINPFANRQRSCTAVPRKNGETQSNVLSQLSKKIWDFLIKNGMMISAEYLPTAMNEEPNFQSRTVKDSRKWRLNPVVFLKLCHRWGTPKFGSFCFSGVSPNSSLHVVETRPLQQKQGCFLRSHGLTCRVMLSHFFL